MRLIRTRRPHDAGPSGILLGLFAAPVAALLFATPALAMGYQPPNPTIASATCKTDAVYRGIARRTREIAALDYQLAESQIELNELDAREFTKTNYGPAEQTRHQRVKSRVFNLQYKIRNLRGEVAQLEGLPPCQTPTRTPDLFGPPPSQPTTPPPGRPVGTH